MYILTHPNGWGRPQQVQMRRAAIPAGLIPGNKDGHSRIELVTQGEASLHFCLSNGLTLDGNKVDTGISIVDAGGGTINITAYRNLSDDKFEEISVPAYTHASKGPSLRNFSRHPSIASSRLSLSDKNRPPPDLVFLVGGFPASNWLYEQVQDQIVPLGIPVCHPDTLQIPINKAVSNGAVSFYLDKLVSSRVARATYGMWIHTLYDGSNAQHSAMGHLASVHPITGEFCLFDRFCPILLKGVKVKEKAEFHRTFNLVQRTNQTVTRCSWQILGYSGQSANPTWIDDEPLSYSVVCAVEADVSSVRPEWRISSVGMAYQAISYTVIPPPD
ncbi:hypothetical protein FA13DRAFT_1800163 [Coprinellus micaceus]|uniref:Uncharacterized protein n=1 Tax=Coprinellus micaceus TaxID=71717 RepID=A0A4Y7SH51_COPMI|nr:hypothetical protein FA13DRAFT_1800163 [Coprinellus micaceus]